MLPRRLRLSRQAFTRPMHGARASSAHFSISVVPAPSPGCAVVISKKTARLSVDRHRLKRRVLSILRPWCEGPCAFIVYARAGSSTLPFHALQSELRELLTRAIPQVRAY